MKIKTSEATPIQLDWLVAKCEGHSPTFDFGRVYNNSGHWFTPTSAWVQGGPIIDREKISTKYQGPDATWSAYTYVFVGFGPTQLIAAMRCYVTSKFGDEVEIPEELL